MVKRIVIVVRPEHYTIISNAAEMVGSTVAAWSRSVLMERARVSYDPDRAARNASKAALAADVAKRRETREMRRAAVIVRNAAALKLKEADTAVAKIDDRAAIAVRMLAPIDIIEERGVAVAAYDVAYKEWESVDERCRELGAK